MNDKMHIPPTLYKCNADEVLNMNDLEIIIGIVN